MQKLLKRTQQATKQAGRKILKKQRQLDAEAKAERIREESGHLAELRTDLKTARLERREKWDLGPLAPRRDVFDNYGASDNNRHSRQSPLRTRDLEARCAWAGGVKWLSIVPKDRVVLLEGPEKGKIDRIESIDLQSGTVTLETIAKMTSTVPDAFRKGLGAGATQNSSVKVPISAIRLVHPVVDPKTGVARDVIIRQLVAGKASFQRGWRGWARFVTGTNISIPWPPRDKPDSQDFPCDTQRSEVEEVTFTPTMLLPPMPEKVIDELRNRYSRFRTRHEPEYIDRKVAEEEAKKALKNASATDSSVRTPLQEFNRQQREARRARGEPSLNEAMLQKIGEVIAANKARTLNAAGISAVPPAAAPEVGDAAAQSAQPTAPSSRRRHRPLGW